MTNCIVRDAGDFRRGEEGVFNGSQCVFMAPPARYVPQLMNDLFDWMKEARTSVHPLVLGSVFHYEFVFIPVFEYIPIESQIEKFQEEYYGAIARCHAEGASTHFIEFMLWQIDKILDDISVQISEDSESLSECIKKLLAVMEYDVPYTSRALMEKLGLKSKEGFRRNYLRPAMDKGLLRMTIPDKPNSRNQRYSKT